MASRIGRLRRRRNISCRYRRITSLRISSPTRRRDGPRPDSTGSVSVSRVPKSRRASNRFSFGSTESGAAKAMSSALTS